MKWFKNLNIRAKLLIGFIIVALIGGAIGVAGFSGLQSIQNALLEITDFRMIATYALDGISLGQLEVVVGARGLLNPLLGDIREDSYKRIEDGYDMIQEAWSDYEVLPIGDVQRAQFQKLTGEWAKWQDAMNHLIVISQDIDRLLASGLTVEDEDVVAQFDLAISHYQNEITPKRAKTEHTIDEMVERNEQMVEQDKNNAVAAHSSSLILLASFAGAGIVVSVLLGVFLANMISRPVNQLAGLADSMALGHVDLELAADSKDEIGHLMRSFGAVLESIKEQVELVETMAIGDLNVDIRPRSDKDVLAFSLQNLIAASKEQQAVAESLADGDLTIDVEPRSEKDALGHAIKRLVESLNLVMAEIQGAAEQVAAAADQISAGSQAVAQGSAEQASSLEEVSSSLEELASMTKTNADNAEQAQSLSQAASGSAMEGRQAMDHMNQAIAEIKEASDETARIIKTIDDIAFQTNLLALNAAVEAARAGEAGRGFAVVSEEVRNLALRSAEAAKDTARMIEESVKRADNGVKIAGEVHKSLQDITEGTDKVKEFVREITAASQEQSRGLDQINVAAAQMNKVTQENAANAEESASGSEELASQVSQLRQTIGWFKVDNKRQGSKRAVRPRGGNGPTQTDAGELSAQTPVVNKKKTLDFKQRHVIPLDDDEDFEGF